MCLKYRYTLKLFQHAEHIHTINTIPLMLFTITTTNIQTPHIAQKRNVRGKLSTEDKRTPAIYVQIPTKITIFAQ